MGEGGSDGSVGFSEKVGGGVYEGVVHWQCRWVCVFECIQAH